jgi:hypothetical protein
MPSADMPTAPAVSKMVHDVNAMLSSRRCGAKTRSGELCRSPAVRGRARCRMHGGAKGSGAPRGNKNALKRGDYTRERIQERRLEQELLRQARMLARKYL